MVYRRAYREALREEGRISIWLRGVPWVREADDSCSTRQACHPWKSPLSRLLGVIRVVKDHPERLSAKDPAATLSSAGENAVNKGAGTKIAESEGIPTFKWNPNPNPEELF